MSVAGGLIAQPQAGVSSAVELHPDSLDSEHELFVWVLFALENGFPLNGAPVTPDVQFSDAPLTAAVQFMEGPLTVTA